MATTSTPERRLEPRTRSDGRGKPTHLLRIRDLTRDDVLAVLDQADDFRTQGWPAGTRGFVAILCFFQPSTRTRLGFHSAVARLGGTAILLTEQKPGAGSAAVETLEDSIRVVSDYSDLLVLRHPDASALDSVAAASSCPVVNGGNGADEHPTQALIDLFAIRRHAGRLNGLRIGVVGDLLWSRCTHSLLRALEHFDPSEIRLMHPPECGLPRELQADLRLPLVEFDDGLHVADLDVLYVAGLPGTSADDATRSRFRVTASSAEAMPTGAVVLNPLPRIDEIAPDLDETPRAGYFQQSRDGLFVRMAIVSRCLGQDNQPAGN